MDTINRNARVAGLLYLLFVITCIFAGVVRANLAVYGDAAATAQHLAANGGLFRLSFMSDVVSAVFFLLAAWALYVLLKPVNQDLALLFLLLNLGGVAVQSLNLLFQLAGLLLLSGAGYLQAFTANQLQALAMLFVDFHRHGFIIAQIFYGTWLFPLGYLVYRSGFLPRWLGVVLMLDCAGVLIWFFQFFLLPGYEIITYPGLAISFTAEISLSLWLLVMGAKTTWQKTRVLDSSAA